MREMSAREMESYTGDPYETERICLNQLEFCALRAALERESASISDILDTETELKMADKHMPSLQRKFEAQEDQIFAKVNPQLVAVYMAGAMEERKFLETLTESEVVPAVPPIEGAEEDFEEALEEASREKVVHVPPCKHTVAMHVKALDSLINLLKTSPVAQSH